MSKKAKFVKVTAATALLTSAALPVMAAEATTTYSGVVLKDAEGKLYSISKADYELAVALGNLPAGVKVEYVEVNGQPYSMNDYGLIVALGTTGDAAFAELAETKDPVVDESIQPGKIVDGKLVAENDTPSEVTSVSAITETVFKAADQQLEFSVTDDGKAADLEALKAAGYEVTFLSTTTVTEDGKVDATNLKSFSYQVEISKDGEVVATSTEKTVKVVNGAQAAKITAHEIKQDGSVVNTIIVGSGNAQINITKYETLDGNEETGSVAGVTYKSDKPGVVVVTASGELIPLTAGTANITISKEGLEDYVVPVTVGAEARTADTLTGLTDVTLSVSDSVTEEKELTVVVKDQYDEFVSEGTKLTVTSSDTTVATVTETLTVGAKGEVKLEIKPATPVKSGTSTITVKSGDKVLGTAKVTVKAAGAVASYALETDAADLTLDLNKKLETLDNTLTFKFVSRDAEGLLVADLTNAGYTIESSNPEVATIENGVVTAKTVGTTTITVKEGTITRASKTITVVDTTPPVAPSVTTGLNGTTLANFGLNDAGDADNTTFKLTYSDSTQSIGDAEAITFDVPVKLASIAIDGKQVSEELIYQLVAKAGTNFVTAYTKTIDLAPIGAKISDLEKMGKKITVKFVNEAGTEATYTFTLEKETPAK